jgi:hypothetical protein
MWFFLLGYVKNFVFIPPLPHYLKEMKEHIMAAVSNIDGDMLHRVWDGLDCRINMCHAK